MLIQFDAKEIGKDSRGFVSQIFALNVSPRYNRRAVSRSIHSLRRRKESVIATLSTIAEKPSRLVAVAEALTVNLIWASTFILIKIGLRDLGPLTLSGLRYFVGFLILLPLVVRNRNAVGTWTPRVWIRLILIGVAAYVIGNGALFWALQYVPATTGSFILSLLPLPVLFVGIFWLKEIPTRWQYAGIAVALVGSVLFFSPGLSAGEPFAIAVALFGLIGFVLFGILGREVARDRQVDTLSLTAVPLATGGGLALAIALLTEGAPRFSPTSFFVVVWLAAINTALGYILYNHSLQVLTAFEMNMLNDLAPLITATLAWLFLGENVEPIQIVGIVILVTGIALVEWGRRNGESHPTQKPTSEPKLLERDAAARSSRAKFSP